jgi:glutamate racemase
MLPTPHHSVLVVDSGIGGMTVVRAVLAQGSNVTINYIADRDWFPYGGLAGEKLASRIEALIAQALERFPVDAAVIACNTASTIVLDRLRAKFPVPFVGVVPAVKTASERSASRVIGLLATENTVDSAYLDRLIQEFAADCRVIRIASPSLAGLAEAKARGQFIDRINLSKILMPFANTPALDTVVLGCTHYPILQNELAAILNPAIEWLDPAPAVARQLSKQLAAVPPSTTDHEHRIYFTGTSPLLRDLRPFLAAAGFRRARYWSSEPISVEAAVVDNQDGDRATIIKAK